MRTCGVHRKFLEESIRNTIPGLESIENTIILSQRGRWIVVIIIARCQLNEL